MLQFLSAFIQARRNDESGAVAAEYGLLIVLVALVMAVGATFLGTQLSALFADVGDRLF